MKIKLVLLFLCAFSIRLVSLNQSLWLDEAITANVVKNLSILQIITKFSPTDFHPPLFYLLEKLWTNFFGYSEIALRFPSLLSSLITGVFVYLIGKKLKNETVGFWAALFFLFNPLIIYYSQEARMYSLQTLFLTMVIYFFLRRSYLLFNLFSALSLFTHYGSAFFLATLFFYLIFKKQYRQLIKFLPGTLLSLLILSPLLYHQFIYSQVALKSVTNWSLVLGKSNLKNFFMIFTKFVTGRLSFYPKIMYYLISISTSIIVYIIALKSSSRFLKYLFIFPLILAFVVSIKSPMLSYFRYLYLIPVLSLMLALASIQKIFRYLILSIFILFSATYLFLPQFHREDWASLAASLPTNASVYLIPSFADPLLYYHPDVHVFDIHQINTSPALVIPYGVEIYGLQYQPSNLSLISTKSFRGLTTELWQK